MPRSFPYLAVCLAPLILFAPFLLGWQVMYWGTPLFQFYPWRQLALDMLQSGQLPLWNSYLGNGAPLIANHQSAVFYPPNWIAFIVPLDYSLGLLTVLHLIWAGAGMVTLARTLGLRPTSQAVAGVAFGASQYLVARSGFISINNTAAWLPWLVWATDQFLSDLSGGRDASLQTQAFATAHLTGLGRSRLKYALLLSLFLALQLLAGHAQTTWYSLLIVGAWAIWRVGSLNLTPPHRLHALLRTLLPLIFALGLAALQLLPTAELLRESPRATAANYDFVMTYSFSPWRFFTLLAPDLLGNPARGQFYGYGNYWEDAIYIGLLPLLLSVWGIWCAFFRPTAKPSPVKTLAFMALVSAVLALGQNTPVFPFLYQYLPTFNLFQAPARIMLGLVFALALLAGYGLEQWEPMWGGARRWLQRAWVAALSVVITGGLVWGLYPGDTPLALQFLTVARALCLAGLMLLIALTCLLRQPKTETGWWSGMVLGAVCLDLILAGYGLNPGAPADLYRAATASGAPLRAQLQTHRLFYFPSDDYDLKFQRYLSFKTFGSPDLAQASREAQLPNVAAFDGLASANNYDPLLSARHVALLEVISQTRSISLLNLMDVAVVASPTPLEWEAIRAGGDVAFYRVPGEAQRVRVVYQARTVSDAPTALAALAQSDFDPNTTVILEADNAGRAVAGLNIFFDTVPLTVSLTQPGWVMLSDTDYPGWEVWVDDQPATLLHADYAFRAVAVAAGDHQVEFRYVPRMFLVGLGISGVCWVVWLIGLINLWRVSEARSRDFYSQ